MNQRLSAFYNAFLWTQGHFARLFWGVVLSVGALYAVTGSSELLACLLTAPVLVLLGLGTVVFTAVVITRAFTRRLA